VLIGEDSCGFADHMNEYDDKLKTFTIQEENQKMHSDDWGNSGIPTRQPSEGQCT
jgi:hypothetical protein